MESKGKRKWFGFARAGLAVVFAGVLSIEFAIDAVEKHYFKMDVLEFGGAARDSARKLYGPEVDDWPGPPGEVR